MEVEELLNAIVEVSHSVTRMKCPLEEKEEVLKHIKTLFSCYGSIARLFESGKSSVVSGISSCVAMPVEESCTGVESGEGSSRIVENIQNINEKLSILESKVCLNAERVCRDTEQLRMELNANVAVIDQLKISRDDVASRVAHIENKSNELDLLQNKMKQISYEVESRSGVTTRLAEFQNEFHKVYQEIATIRPKGFQDLVAFTAKALINPKKYKPGDIIIFGNVLFNLDHCFDSITSKFTCKSLGLYTFTASINTNTPGDFTAAIMHDDDEVALFGTCGTKDLQTGASAVMLLHSEDVVCIKITSQSDRNGVQVGGGFSSFIGYQIA